jgi:hypothetical protein
MQTSIITLTETEAVNRILSTVGAEKVADLTSLSLIADSAYDALRDALRDIQSHPWGFNTEYDVVLTPNGSDEITFATSDYIAAVDFSPQNAGDFDVVLRDDGGTSKLYDRKDHSFTNFSGDSYKATITYYLQFEDCPEIVKIWATAAASIHFQSSQVGNAQIDAILRTNYSAAKAAFMSYEAAQESWSIFDNYDLFKIVSGAQRPVIGGGGPAWWGTR